MPLTDESPRSILPDDEMRDLARVVKAALGVLIKYWRDVLHLSEFHPYRQAARMVQSYLEKRYGV